MLREVLFAKIHRATVTHCDPQYMGSITIDPLLLEATGMVVNEKVLIADCENGNRFETYIFLGEYGSGEIRINGAAANLTGIGHQILIMSFCQLDENELKRHRPKVVICDSENGIAQCVTYPPSTPIPTEIVSHIL